MNVGEGKENKINTEREVNHKRLLNTGNWRLMGMGGWGGENGWWALRNLLGEHWVLYVSDESHESTEAKTTMYVS